MAGASYRTGAGMTPSSGVSLDAGVDRASMADIDWAATPLGAPERWSETLRATVCFLQASHLPLILWWGADQVSIHNAAFSELLGVKGRGYIGVPARECRSAIRNSLEPVVVEALAAGASVQLEDIALEVDRRGIIEERHFAVDCSPVSDSTASNGVGGVIITLHDVSATIVDHRRLDLLHELASHSQHVNQVQSACEIAARSLSYDPLDVPFALIYRVEPGGARARLAASAGVDANRPVSPATIELDAVAPVWPLAEVARTRQSRRVDNLRERFGAAVPAGPWFDPPTTAVVSPVMSRIAGQPYALLVAGVSSRLILDKPYRDFLNRLARQLAVTIANANTCETEARRAEQTQAAIEAARGQLKESDSLRREAENTARARDEVLAMVSHDLRSPLSGIAMTAEAIERRMTAQQTAYLGRQVGGIKRAVDVMDGLINDLLDMVSLDAGRLKLNVSGHSARELVAEAVARFESQARQQRVTLKTAVARDLPAPVCDKSRVLQVFSNLIANALKFTPEGGRVAVRAESTAAGIRFTVADTGQGIEPEALPHVFDRYWRGGEAAGNGHGLGLAIANGIVKAHGGTIRGESALRKGSAFSFVLPLEMSLADTDRPDAGSASDMRGDRAAIDAITVGDGETGERLRRMDWSRTPLGPVRDWPESLRGSLALCLGSQFPMAIWWGSERVQLYNDAFAALLDPAKWSKALGRPAVESWPDTWSTLSPMTDRVMTLGETVRRDDFCLARERGGLKERFFTFCQSPIRDAATGAIEGALTIVTETTPRVIDERRLKVLRQLSARLATNKTEVSTLRSIQRVLKNATRDIPFVLLYRIEDGVARLVVRGGVARDTPCSATEVAADRSPWPLAAVLESGRERVVTNMDPARFGPLPGGPWKEAPGDALVLPLNEANVMVAGISPRLALTAEYRAFLRHLGRRIASGILGIQAYESERSRVDALKELDRARTTFFSDISHELRTPLALILDPVEDALSTGKSLAGETLELVCANAMRLYKMTDTYLDFARLEADRTQAAFAPIDLARLTRDLASTFRSTVESAGLSLNVECPSLPDPVYVDAEMWEKIVFNLLSNAVKYTHEGEIDVMLRRQAETVALTVSDTGIGIADDDLEGVFERFYRGHTGEGRSHEGTGIGLALTKGLVELHGGAINVESQLGAGSTFTVELPQGVAHLPTERVKRQPDVRSTPVDASWFAEEARRWSPANANPSENGDRGARADAADDKAVAHILIVEDNADLRGYVSGLLRRSFTRVDTAANGRDALEAARSEPPDLVLSDVLMPGVSGLELVRELRANDETRAVPIILLSARADEDATLEGLENGADDYMIKPFFTRQLLRRVRTQLEMARLRRETARDELENETLRQYLAARDEFLSLASHELRTPLTAIRLQAAALLRLAGESGNKAQLDKLNESILRLAGLVDDLLDVSRITAGRLILRPETVDLVEIIHRAADNVAGKGSRTNTPVNLLLPESATGEWDRERIEQIVAKLLSNALKHGAGKQVEVGIEADDDGARLWVRDRGSGVPADEQARIFERFERAVPANQYGGLGLGLWLVRQIVEAMGGYVGVDSVEGEGATFTLQLPRKAGAASSDADSADRQ